MAFGGNTSAGKASPFRGPGIATFRCPSTTVGDLCSTLLRPDRILSDGAAYAGAEIAGTFYGGFIDVAGELAIRLQSGGSRFIHLDFSEALSQPCVDSTFGCRRTFVTFAAHDAYLHTNTLDPTGTDEISGGLGAIPVGQSRPSRLRLLFTTPDASWDVRFNKRDYPGSTHVTTTRTATNEWIIESTEQDIARLVSVAGSRKEPGAGARHEGLYTMPFRIHMVR
jgi:hypothetical protein